MPPSPRRRWPSSAAPVGAPVAATVVVAGLLSGCASRVGVQVAPFAADPLCAQVVLALPDTLGDLPGRRTTSQATAAWGESDPVVLRCGVVPPGPTTDQCVTAQDGATAVDWVAVPGDPAADGTTAWTFTTYGRSPAVEVHVPASVTATRSTSFLLELGPAISRVGATRHCL